MRAWLQNMYFAGERQLSSFHQLHSLLSKQIELCATTQRTAQNAEDEDVAACLQGHACELWHWSTHLSNANEPLQLNL